MTYNQRFFQNLCVNVWIPVIFRPSGVSALKTGLNSVKEITVQPQKYFSSWCHPQMQVKEKKKPNANMIQKLCCLLWAKAHLKSSDVKWKTVLWSDRSIFEILFKESRTVWWYGGALVPMELSACTSAKAPSILKGIQHTDLRGTNADDVVVRKSLTYFCIFQQENIL